MKVTNAKGIKGCLLLGMIGTYFFRVYDRTTDPKNWTFIDYDIASHDIEIEIIDDTIELIERENGYNTIDESEQTLGRKHRSSDLPRKKL